MRTTLSIDDDVLEAARKLAEARRPSVGQVVSDLMRRGLVARMAPYRRSQDLPVFAVAEDSPLITLGDVKRDEDEPD